MQKSLQQGFTLVELAIVLMIIGLLIGGILRGQELINNAKISGTIEQVKAYTGAYVTFRDMYSNHPGDMPNATKRIPGCTTDNFCGDGDGDGLIGNVLPSGSGYDSAQAGKAALPFVETSYFWKHLALAHLISGVNPSTNPVSFGTGITHPSAKLGGAFIIFYSTVSTDWGAGHIIKLQPSPRNVGGEQGQSAVSPIHAYQLDLKMDDGLPNKGKVEADSSGSNCDPGSKYANTEELNCVMYFQID